VPGFQLATLASTQPLTRLTPIYRNIFTLAGLALDEENELLYVGDDTNDVKYYDTNDWSKEGEISITDSAIGIAIDVPNQHLYTGAAWLGNSYYST